MMHRIALSLVASSVLGALVVGCGGSGDQALEPGGSQSDGRQQPPFNTQRPIGNSQQASFNSQEPSFNDDQPQGSANAPGGLVGSCNTFCLRLESECSGGCEDFCNYVEFLQGFCGVELAALFQCGITADLSCNDENPFQPGFCRAELETFQACVERLSDDDPDDGPPPGVDPPNNETPPSSEI